jgi:hypothetical protein
VEAVKRRDLRGDGPFPTAAVDVNYFLRAWTLFGSDMEQISAQIVKKFEGNVLIHQAGVAWPTVVKLLTVANNLDSNGNPPKGSTPVYKYQFDLIAETFLCLPGHSPESNQSEQGRQPQAASALSGSGAASVRHKCPACGRGLKMNANVAGRRIPCPACKAVLQISPDLQRIDIHVSRTP